MDLNDYATEIYEQNKAVGWWDDPDRCLFECLQLISTEVAEATEGERKDLMDDHLPHRKMGEVELADALIRTLDLGGSQGWVYRQCVPDDEWEDHLMQVKDYSVGKRHLAINCEVASVAEALFDNRTVTCYGSLVDSILIVAQSFGYDIIAAMDEKLVYNQHRQDHKRENRAQTHGKKF